MSSTAPKIEVAIADTLFKSMQNLPSTAQKPVYEFITKFRNNPRSPGINYETIRNAREPNYRSVRINRNYRGIVLQPETGNVYMLLWVDNHDDAYDWAQRTRCTIHPATGSLQIYESTVVTDDAPAEPATDYKAPEDYDLPPLFDITRDDYMQLGVPEEHIEDVESLHTMDELVAMQPKLPVEAYEALTFLAEGETITEILSIYGTQPDAEAVDTTDYKAALERPATKRRFHIYTEDEELRRMLARPLDEWRVYLHQEQRKYAFWDVNGPIRVLGGAGTGKTVVAMHRAHWLVSKYLKDTDDKVLFTTFTANLALDIRANLRSICTPEELERIEVKHLNAWVSNFVRNFGYERRIVYDNPDDVTYRGAWEAAEMEIPERLRTSLPPSFFKDEWHRVILPQNVQDIRGYVRADRTGRGVGLTRRQRAEVWPVFETLRAELTRRNAAPFEDAVHHAMQHLSSGGYRPAYRAVVIDEAQDFGLAEFKLLRALVPENPNDMFLVGDAHQRIYGRGAPLSHAGIQIVGRARRLRLNYRTSEEIRDFATEVLTGLTWDDLDTGTDETSDYKSLFHSQEPVLSAFESRDDEGRYIAQEIQALCAEEGDGMHLSDICVVARTDALVQSYQDILEDAGLKTHRISRQEADAGDTNAVRIATIHRVKGLGFRAVFVAGVADDIIPHPAAIASEDPTEREHGHRAERSLLHVACTRAVSHLYVTWYGNKSGLLP